jgi:DNA-binding CsgD family transcriptional regulator
VAAAVRADAGEYEAATRLLAATAAFAASVGMRSLTAVRMLADTMLAACREQLGAACFAAAWAQAGQLTLTEAVGYATRGRGRRSRPKTGWESLTPTEKAVVAAITEGLSNPQIAGRMFISRRTVTTHLTSIFRKLGMSSRAELAGAAARRP